MYPYMCLPIRTRACVSLQLERHPRLAIRPLQLALRPLQLALRPLAWHSDSFGWPSHPSY